MALKSVNKQNFNTKWNSNWNWEFKEYRSSFYKFESSVKYHFTSVYGNNMPYVYILFKILDQKASKPFKRLLRKG